MKKIFKLFINENIKTWKKLSTKILIILVLLALVGTFALVQVMKKVEENVQVNISTYDWREDIKSQLEHYTKQLEQENLDEETKKSIEIQKERCQLSLDYDISPYGTNWKANLLDEIVEIRVQQQISKETQALENEIQKLLQIIKNDNFEEYIGIEKENLKLQLDEKEITQPEYDDQLLILDLKVKYSIGKTEDEEYWKRTMLYNIESAQKSIRTGIDEATNKVLTVEKKEEYEELIIMSIYRLENNLPSIEYTNSYRTMFEALAPAFVSATIAIAAIIIAGGAISSEVSTGTIKFWALTPNRRWKIMTAKILSILFYILVLTLIISLLTTLFSNIFFEEQAESYIYVKDGKIETINNTLYLIAMYFAKMIPVILFTLLALMLSTLTRNTAVAVSFSMALYMGNGIAMTIINQFIKKDWIRYIPFNNLNIADKIFPNAYNPISLGGETFATSTSLEFSLVIISVCAILMLVTLYDSFNKRDII